MQAHNRSLSPNIQEAAKEEPARAGLTGLDRVRAAHRSLLDPTVPLLAQSWLKDRLVLGDNGVFPKTARNSATHPVSRHTGSRLVVELCQLDPAIAQGPSLSLVSEGKVVLRYNTQSLTEARAALIASASQGGWPIARDTESLALLTLAERIAASDIPVLLEGPTGTGKEVYARFVHRMSTRRDGPFIAVNCAAMPEAMLEGLLFGHRKGAFTGAGEAREGLFLAADGGTLLLDEIGELPLALQAKLLRTLQEGEVLPLGATKPVKVDVRIVAATNRTLSTEAAEGRFREDLYYRLNVFPLVLPALKDRVSDIAPLAFGMVLRHGAQAGLPAWVSAAALARLETHIWPGNVRELENVIRRAILLAGDAGEIDAQHIVFDQATRSGGAGSESAAGLPPPSTSETPSVGSSLSDVAFQSEAQAILQALDTHGGHRGKTAASLGISERTLRYRLASMRESGLLQAGAET